MTLVRQKVTKSSVNYRPATGGRHCKICAMYRAGGECTLVRGIIRPEYVCDKWVSKGKPGGSRRS